MFSCCFHRNNSEDISQDICQYEHKFLKVTQDKVERIL